MLTISCHSRKQKKKPSYAEQALFIASFWPARQQGFALEAALSAGISLIRRPGRPAAQRMNKPSPRQEAR